MGGAAKDRIDLQGFLSILSLTLLWGFNYLAVKISNRGAAPVFICFLRSVIASGLGIIYCLVIGRQLFHRDIRLLHGLVVGCLFGAEFACIYLGLLYTNASRAAIFIYLSPFIVALGAHLFLRERLTPLKTLSLICAFAGIYLVFRGKPTTYSPAMFFGDILQIAAAFLWAATTVYIKKFLAGRVEPIHTFLYQLVFSIPILLAVALLIEPVWIKEITAPVVISLFYQSVIVAFASYLVWFWLIHTYPVASLSVFTFLAPVFGVASGVIFLGEEVTLGLVLGLLFICAGIYGTNYQPRNR